MTLTEKVWADSQQRSNKYGICNLKINYFLAVSSKIYQIREGRFTWTKISIKRTYSNCMHRKHLAEKVWGASQGKSCELTLPIGTRGDTGNQF